jgi:hypothetical protein
MEYAVGGLAVLGAMVGLMFRFRVLLPVILLIFLASLLLSLHYHLGLVETLLTILAAQALLQGGYFGGLVIRTLFKAAQRRLVPSSSERCRSR